MSSKSAGGSVASEAVIERSSGERAEMLESFSNVASVLVVVTLISYGVRLAEGFDPVSPLIYMFHAYIR
jgi:hypothetical protein